MVNKLWKVYLSCVGRPNNVLVVSSLAAPSGAVFFIVEVSLMNNLVNNIGDNPHNATVAMLEPGTAGLTPAEIRAFEAVAVGMPRKKAANRLSIAVKTIDSQLGVALSKLGVSSVTEAVALTCQEGLLTFEAVSRGARNLLLMGFIVSSVSQLIAEDLNPLRTSKLPRIGTARMVKRESMA